MAEAEAQVHCSIWCEREEKKNAAVTVVCYSSIRNLIKTKQIGFLFRFIGSSARFTPFIVILNHWFISIRQHSFQDDEKIEMLHSTFLEHRSIIPENKQKPNDFHQIQWILEMSEIDTQPLRDANFPLEFSLPLSIENRTNWISSVFQCEMSKNGIGKYASISPIHYHDGNTFTHIRCVYSTQSTVNSVQCRRLKTSEIQVRSDGSFSSLLFEPSIDGTRNTEYV